MADTPTSITFRTESSGNMAVATPLENIANTVQRLFHIIPGSDDYDPEMGLDIVGRSRTSSENDGSRDTDYEITIMKQLQTYTNIRPLSVIATYENNTLKVGLSLEYSNRIYQLAITSEPDSKATLTALIN